MSSHFHCISLLNKCGMIRIVDISLWCCRGTHFHTFSKEQTGNWIEAFWEIALTCVMSGERTWRLRYFRWNLLFLLLPVLRIIYFVCVCECDTTDKSVYPMCGKGFYSNRYSSVTEEKQLPRYRNVCVPFPS